MTTTIALPEPKITTPGSPWADEQGRTRRATYVLPGQDLTGPYKAIEVSMTHHKSAKAFNATLSKVTITETEYGYSTAYGSLMGNMRRINSEPTARFSKKGLEAFVEATLALLPALVESSPTLQAAFAGDFELEG